MILSFELTMPRNNSWNGRWSGAEKRYFIFSTQVPQKQVDKLAGKSFYYDFGDGWCAKVRVELIDAAEKRRRQKINAGFCGYDWMVRSIKDCGAIFADHQKDKRAAWIESQKQEPVAAGT